jgi:hypothetical protein
MDSKIVTPDQAHSFNVNAATKVGVEKAILLKDFAGWCKINQANNRNIYDGKAWTFNSAKALQDLYPYMKRRSINRWLNELVEDGYLYEGEYNKSKYDRTKWYSVNEEKYMELCGISIGQNGQWVGHNGQSKGQNGQPIPPRTTSYASPLSQEKSGIENSLKSQHDIEKEKSCAKKESLPPEEQRILEAKKEVMRYFEEWPAMKERAEAAIQGSGKALSVVLEEWARNRLKVPYVLQNAHSHVSSDFIPWCDREGKFSAARKRKGEKKNTQAPAPIVNEYGKKREKGNELGLF